MDSNKLPKDLEEELARATKVLSCFFLEMEDKNCSDTLIKLVGMIGMTSGKQDFVEISLRRTTREQVEDKTFVNDSDFTENVLLMDNRKALEKGKYSDHQERKG